MDRGVLPSRDVLRADGRARPSAVEFEGRREPCAAAPVARRLSQSHSWSSGGSVGARPLLWPPYWNLSLGP